MVKINSKADFKKLSMLGKIALLIFVTSFCTVFILFIPYSFKLISNNGYAIIVSIGIGVNIICSAIINFDQIRTRRHRAMWFQLLLLILYIMITIVLISHFIVRVIHPSL